MRIDSWVAEALAAPGRAIASATTASTTAETPRADASMPQEGSESPARSSRALLTYEPWRGSELGLLPRIDVDVVDRPGAALRREAEGHGGVVPGEQREQVHDDRHLGRQLPVAAAARDPDGRGVD